jgi:hypothetical protein
VAEAVGEALLPPPPGAPPSLQRQVAAPAALGLALGLRKYDPARDGPLPARPLVARPAPAPLSASGPPPPPVSPLSARCEASREAEDLLPFAALPLPGNGPALKRSHSLPETAAEKASAAGAVAGHDISAEGLRASALFLAHVFGAASSSNRV